MWSRTVAAQMLLVLVTLNPVLLQQMYLAAILCWELVRNLSPMIMHTDSITSMPDCWVSMLEKIG
ncbi:hypothetical protein GLYMA_20G156067v4 [Glycine max]|nr:hypothetical protein GLYMA_20G156067v4 [Glycine max]KAH1036293.1 hypothetical protein GYH30_055988 [Glycine max]